MPDPLTPRVAVYLDFDNIVMSWYDRVHGRNSYSRDRQRIGDEPADPEIAQRLAAATIDVGAIIDYAASFGTLVLTRAYADWSAPVNAGANVNTAGNETRATLSFDGLRLHFGRDGDIFVSHRQRVSQTQ